MNKFAAFIVLAIAAVASAELSEVEQESQFAWKPNNDEETSGLGEAIKYQDFCIQSRDNVFATGTQETNDAASNFFNLLFKNAEDIVVDALKAQTDATSALGKQIAHPELEVEGDDTIANARRSVSESRIQPKSFFNAVFGVLQNTKENVSSNLYNKFLAIKEKASPMLAIAALEKACDRVQAFEHDINEQFNNFRDSIGDNDFTYDQVHCTTKDRMIKLNGLCNLGRTVRGPLNQMRGVSGRTEAN